MSTLDRSNRSWGPSTSLPENLWTRFEETNLFNVKELIRSMEISISYGWMGVAAEISEYLQLTASEFLDNDPAMRLQVEIERLKRFSYMGFEQATRLASNRVLNFIEALRDRTPAEELLVSESIAVTSGGWFLDEPKKVEQIIERCKDIDSRFENTTSKNRSLCASFMHALEGRCYALKQESQGCNLSFQKANKLCKENGFSLPLAHIVMHYADSLRLLNDWAGATRLAKDFLNECCKDQKNPFRSHLLLRAILLLLEAPKEFVSPAEFGFNAYRYRMLLYAMGLEESESLYPLLEKTGKLLSKKEALAKPDLYQLFMPGPILNRVNSFDGPSFEKLVLLYYQSKSFKVIDVGDSLPAVDLVALEPAEPQQAIAIQAKNRNEVTQPNRVPTENDFDDAKRALARNSVHDVSMFHWHSAFKLQHRAEELLTRRIHGCFGESCKLRVILNDELVDDLLIGRHIELLFRIFSNEFKTKGDSRNPVRDVRRP